MTKPAVCECKEGFKGHGLTCRQCGNYVSKAWAEAIEYLAGRHEKALEEEILSGRPTTCPDCDHHPCTCHEEETP